MTERTGVRGAIIAAFNRLALTRREARPPVADLIAEAKVARSTFYEHFDGRDAVLVEAFEAPLSVIADAAVGHGSVDAVVGILDHLRDYRRNAIEMLTGPLAPRFVRSLAALIEARGGSGAIYLADQQIGFIRLWLTNELRGSADEIAILMIKSASAQRGLDLQR